MINLSTLEQKPLTDASLALTTQTHINAEITKKGLDVAKDSINSAGSSFKQFKSHLPLVALIMNLVGYGLSLLACCLDTNSPFWYRGLCAIALVMMAIGACAIFSFSASNPIITLGIGLAMIITNVLLKGFEVAVEVIKLFRFKQALNAPTNHDKSQMELANSHKQQISLENKLDALLFELSITDEKQEISKQIRNTQSKLCKIKQTHYQLENRQSYLQLQCKLQNREVKRKIKGLGLCLLSCCLGIIGLYFAPLYPLVGIGITASSFALDCIGLYRKVRAKLRGLKTEKKKNQAQIDTQNEQIIDSISRIKTQEINNRASYAAVINELKSLTPSNEGNFEQPITPVIGKTKKTNDSCVFFSQVTAASNDDEIAIEAEGYDR